MQEQLRLPAHWKQSIAGRFITSPVKAKQILRTTGYTKVRDKYETFIDTSTMQPLKFIRNVNEGGYKKYQNVTFSKTANTAITTNGVFKVPSCVQDVVSSMYYARNVDFSQLRTR
jgi:hypothetical protein